MINQTPEQSHLNSLRLKAKLDEASRLESTRNEALKVGREEGEKKGREEGEKKGLLIGRIVTLQELLGVVEPTRDQLPSFEITALAELADQFQHQLRNRS